MSVGPNRGLVCPGLHSGRPRVGLTPLYFNPISMALTADSTGWPQGHPSTCREEP